MLWQPCRAEPQTIRSQPKARSQSDGPVDPTLQLELELGLGASTTKFNPEWRGCGEVAAIDGASPESIARHGQGRKNRSREAQMRSLLD